ncbi:nuclear transport factor 2 family protein [Branchiibius cervicis]|uniref:Nuclear transport factor 2 family protein n=1 Tax=Branchiibius cervicis TaxID=908252 RepID=A0ABW2APP7_9MICO
MSAKDLLIEMFDRMVVAKDASLLEHYYDPGFRLATNGATQTYAEFAAGHETVYATAIGYDIRYDDAAWVEGADRVAGRVWITTTRPGEEPTEVEVVLIATLKDGRIHRLWELTWPDWSQLKAFESYQEAAGSMRT